MRVGLQFRCSLFCPTIVPRTGVVSMRRFNPWLRVCPVDIATCGCGEMHRVYYRTTFGMIVAEGTIVGVDRCCTFHRFLEYLMC